MTSTPGLFPELLGADFSNLAPVVRDVHCGHSLELHGRADVSRGSSFVARILCALGRLAREQRDAPVRVVIEARGRREVWTRYFDLSPIMRSVLSARRGALRERLGPVALEFTLHAERGAVTWRPVRASVFGVPMPASWLSGIEARAFDDSGGYAFDVRVALPRIGLVIGYRGRLARA